MKKLIMTLVAFAAVLLFAGCANGAKDDTGNQTQKIDKIEPVESDYDFIYEVINKSDKNVTTAVFVSDNSKYNKKDPDAAIVAITEEVVLAPNENHEFKFKIDAITEKYGTNTCFGFYYIPEDDTRSRGWMNGTVYGKGRKHTVTINEYLNGVNSWSFLPDNPMKDVHGYWEGNLQGKKTLIRLCADGSMSLVIYNVGANGKIEGCTESDGSWTCDENKSYADYYDVIEKAYKNLQIPYTLGTDSIEITIDGAKGTWSASETFEVDCWRQTTERNWSDLAEKEDDKYVYYSYGYNKLPKQYWKFEDSLIFYKVSGNEIASMYYENCSDAIESALNNREFFVSDFEGGCLVLNENPQSKQNAGSGSGQTSNQSEENSKLQEEGYIKLDMSKYAEQLAPCNYVHIERKAEGSDTWQRVMLYQGSGNNKLESDVVLIDYYVNKGTKYSYQLRAWNFSYAPIDMGTFTAENGLGELTINNGKATYDENEHALVFSKLPSYGPDVLAGEWTSDWILYSVEGSTKSEFVYFYPKNIKDGKLYLKNATDVEKYLGKKIVPYDVKYQMSTTLENKCSVFWEMEILLEAGDTSYPEITIPANLADL